MNYINMYCAGRRQYLPFESRYNGSKTISLKFNGMDQIDLNRLNKKDSVQDTIEILVNKIEGEKVE